jgi:plasmid stabilization system protein ParE
MVWRVDFAPGAERDFGIILQHLTEAYIALGDAPASAVSCAIERVKEIKAQAGRLGHAPGVGAARDDIGAGLRHVAFDRAIYWFIADAEARAVTVLAVFLAGEDHHRKMASRLRRGRA